MLALSVSELTLSFGTNKILEGISFSVNEGERVGIIGQNGAGKTSLFKIIKNEYTADSGAVYVMKGASVGMLEQNPDHTSLPGALTCLQYMYTAHGELLKLEEEIALAEGELARTSGDEAVRALSRLNSLNERFAKLGGLEFRGRCRGMLLRLGFTDELINQRISTLSGGQYTRLALARLLATEPDILMLDEPTNHLDTDSLTWLEGFIAGYKKTVLIISHDRYFLDRTTDKTLLIQRGRAKMYNGGYTACREQQEADNAAQEKRYREQQKVIAKIRANIEFQRRCNREHNYVTIRSKEKQLERMEKVERAERAPREIRLSFKLEEESANDVIKARDVGFSYGGDMLIENLSFLIKRRERVMFLGPNGSGKSTLMKLLNSRLVPTRGKIELGYNIKIGYYDQENRGLCESNTVFEELHNAYPDKTNFELRSTLALFLFGEDDIEKTVSCLSGGERARLTLAKLILKKVNLLILDEPTNHLDIGSAEALENALLAFDGTIVAVSHDRYFINRIATRIIELAKDRPCGMIDYRLDEGDDAYSAYIELRERLRESEAGAVSVSTESASRQSYEERKRDAAKRRSEERRLERAKEEIKALEAELEALEEELFGDAATDYVRAAEIDTRKGEIEERLLALYEIVM